MRTLVSTLGCISFDSYIKPQLSAKAVRLATSCISFDSYIKPQLRHYTEISLCVVYLLIPTSNHNCVGFIIEHKELYIF